MNMNKKILILGIIALAFISAVGYWAYTQLYTNSSDPAPVPSGYTLSQTGNELIPKHVPEELEISLSTTEFPKDPISVQLSKDKVPVLLKIRNSGEEPIQIMLFSTPDGEWPDDPPHTISTQDLQSFYLDKQGQYVFQNAQNQNQRLVIDVK